MSSKRVVYGLLIGSSAAFGLTISTIALSVVWPIWQIPISAQLWFMGAGTLVGASVGALYLWTRGS